MVDNLRMPNFELIIISLYFAALTEPIDIYSEWIDECERVNNLEDDGA
ncbi:hypothetical protein SLEP1_g27080 [Rubroshorea leprosula]|uniref:Transcription elongation factor 1 homolog n=1 Tax=Rubroshorea leprosula TaxID=152421 RepID=A0AAV5JVC5_9ROSI|nr:hypothetical protein SLEP1_g27080 [Rubroshorea leprosula]